MGLDTVNAIYLFAGQGVTEQGMGGEFLSTHPDNSDVRDVFMGLFEQGNAVGREEIPGFSSIENILGMPAELQKEPSRTHMAMYPVSIGAADALEYIAAEAGIAINLVSAAGQSLGMYAALDKAGMLPRGIGFRYVASRGKIMDNWALLHNRIGDGEKVIDPSQYVMAAVAGIDVEHVRNAAFDADVDVTNENSDRLTNIAGPRIRIANAMNFIAAYSRKNVPPIYLPVGAPFHSRWMKGSSEAYKDFVESQGLGAQLIESGVPVICDSTGLEMHASDFAIYAGPHLMTRGNFNAVVSHVIPLAEKEGAVIIALGGSKLATKAITNCFRGRVFSDGKPVKVLQVHSPRTAYDAVEALTR